MGLREARLTVRFVGVGALRLLIAAMVPVTPEEAYHWNYARHLDWSYFDHPPMIAWAIAAGRALFGDTSIGIRVVPVLFSMGALALAGRLARRMYGDRARLWTMLLLAIEPLLSLAGASGFPDSPLLFFWTLALVLAWEALDGGRPGLWIPAGAALGAAMLSKYTAVFFGVSMLGFLLSYAEGRRSLKTPWPYLGAITALAVFSPVFVWNAAHEWVSFRFQSVNRLEDAGEFRVINGLQFLGGQWLSMVPLLLPLLGVAVRDALRARGRAELYLLWSAAPLMLLFFSLSWVRTIHLMWPMPAYVGLTILLARTLDSGSGALVDVYRRGRLWLAGLSAAALLGAGVHAAFFLPGLHPFPGLYGWDRVAERARDLRSSMPEGTFYLGLGRKYTCASQLAFHLREPFRVHGKNLIGLSGLQYDYWADSTSLAGLDAVVVLQSGDRDSGAIALLRQRFKDVEEVERIDVPIGRWTLLECKPLVFQLFRARGYISSVPQVSRP